MGIPTVQDIRNFLEGYCAESVSTSVLTGNTTITSPIIANIDSRDLRPLMQISGSGIPVGTKIASVNSVHPTLGQITLDANATITASSVSLTITYYDVLTDDWITKRRDYNVIPYIERVTRLPLRETGEVTEYHSGMGNQTIILNRRPVIAVTNITYVSIPNQMQTGNLLAATELIKEEGILRSKVNFNEASFEPIFPRGTNNIKITYTYGFTDLVDDNGVTAYDIHECILNMVGKQILVFIGARSGGGELTQTNWSRNYGDRGKYTDIINLFDQNAYSILRKYTTGVIGA